MHYVLATAIALLAPTTPTTTSKHISMMAGNVEFPQLDGKDVRVGIVRARWHTKTCDSLVAGIKDALKECNVLPENIMENDVPGSFELPLAARYLALSGTVDVIIPVGVLIKGKHAKIFSQERFNPCFIPSHLPLHCVIICRRYIPFRGNF